MDSDAAHVQRLHANLPKERVSENMKSCGEFYGACERLRFGKVLAVPAAEELVQFALVELMSLQGPEKFRCEHLLLQLNNYMTLFLKMNCSRRSKFDSNYRANKSQCVVNEQQQPASISAAVDHE